MTPWFWLACKLRAWFVDPWTIVYDRSPFWGYDNHAERVAHRCGFLQAWWFGFRWVSKHQWGAARLTHGYRVPEHMDHTCGCPWLEEER